MAWNGVAPAHYALWNCLFLAHYVGCVACLALMRLIARARARAGSVAAGLSWCRRHVETLQLLVFCPQLGTLAAWR